MADARDTSFGIGEFQRVTYKQEPKNRNWTRTRFRHENRILDKTCNRNTLVKRLFYFCRIGLSAEVKLSSKGQIVIPREVRKKMNLKPGDKVKIEAMKGRKAIIQPAVLPPDDIFVRAGKTMPKKILSESRRNDELKLKRLLRELGAEQ